MSDPAPPQRLSPDGKWWWDGIKWVPSNSRYSLIGALAIVIRACAYFPILLGVAVAIPNVSYYRPMVTTPVGLGILGVAAALVVLVVVLAESGVRLARKRRVGWSIALGAACFPIAFITIWLTLMGPAMLILVTSPQT